MPLYGKKQFHEINRSAPRVDGVDKVTGRATYAADLSFPGMVYGAMLRLNKVPSAKITSIDASEALKLPGVLAVVTPWDLPKCRSWSNYMYLTDRVRYVGDVVALKVCGVNTAHFVDRYGWQELHGFLSDQPLRNAEMLVEDDYGMIDGIINNGKREPERERSSVAKQLRKVPTRKPRQFKAGKDNPVLE